jgi:cytochrome P450
MPLKHDQFMDSSLHFIFGLDARKKDDGAPFSAQKFHSIWLSGLLGVGLRVGLGSITNILPSSSYTKVCNQIHSFVDFYINQFCSEKNRGNTSTTKRQSVAETIVSTNDDMYSIQSQVIQAMMGAQDTTSSLLGNTIELLARHPLFWEELKREFAEKGDSLLSFDGLRESTVIQNILIESMFAIFTFEKSIYNVALGLRVRPVFPAMGREALRDTTLPVGGGPNCQSPIFVPKGIQGVSNFYMLHRDPTVFGDDVEAFNPHRWTSIKPTSKQFAPFGLGGRSCLGKDKALVEAGYVLARLAKEFEVLEFKGAKVYRGVIKMAMKNAEGCKVAIRRNG